MNQHIRDVQNAMHSASCTGTHSQVREYLCAMLSVIYTGTGGLQNHAMGNSICLSSETPNQVPCIGVLHRDVKDPDGSIEKQYYNIE